jgi:hypothetical protein
LKAYGSDAPGGSPRVARYLEGCSYNREAANAQAANRGGTAVAPAGSEAGIAIETVAALACHKLLNVAQKYARKADQLKRNVQKSRVGDLRSRLSAAIPVGPMS